MASNRLLWLSASFIASTMAPPCSLAATQAETTTGRWGQYLPEIVVTASRPAAAERSTAMWRNTTEDFVAWNAHTVAEGLAAIPGLNLQYGAASADARAWIRGFRDRDVLIMYDGIPIASGWEGTVDLEQLSTGPVAELRVAKSAPSVIYGPNGLGGVIDIIPRRPETTPLTRLSFEVGAEDARVGRITHASRHGTWGTLLNVGVDSGNAFLMPAGLPGFATAARGNTHQFRLGSPRPDVAHGP